MIIPRPIHPAVVGMASLTAASGDNAGIPVVDLPRLQ